MGPIDYSPKSKAIAKVIDHPSLSVSKILLLKTPLTTTMNTEKVS